MFGLTNFVRPNILKTKILHLSMDRIWNFSWQNLTCIYKILNPALIYCREQQQKYVFHQVEFVDKNNLEAQNPRRDTSIPIVSAGLILPRYENTINDIKLSLDLGKHLKFLIYLRSPYCKMITGWRLNTLKICTLEVCPLPAGWKTNWKWRVNGVEEQHELDPFAFKATDQDTI